MNPDLVHSACTGFAEDDTRLPVVRESLEFGLAVLAFRRDPANADLVADHFDGLGAHYRLFPGKYEHRLSEITW